MISGRYSQISIFLKFLFHLFIYVFQINILKPSPQLKTHKFPEVHKQTAIVRVPETLTNFNPMCTPAGIAETYEAKHAWLSIRPRSYNDTLTVLEGDGDDYADGPLVHENPACST